MRSDPSKRHFELRGLSLSARTQRPLRSCILAILDGRSLRLVRRTRHRQTDLGQVDIAREHGERPDTAAEMVLRQVADADLPVVLRLPPDKGFVCTDRLPPASKDDLRAMVANRNTSGAP